MSQLEQDTQLLLRLEAQARNKLHQINFPPFDPTQVHFVAGVDVSYSTIVPDACAALVVLSYPGLHIVHQSHYMFRPAVPYVPSFLAQREADAIVQLVQQLRHDNPQYIPQAIMVDGNGRLHPRRFGIACHLAAATKIPTIGVAKNLFAFPSISAQQVLQNTEQCLKSKGDRFDITVVIDLTNKKHGNHEKDTGTSADTTTDSISQTKVNPNAQIDSEKINVDTNTNTDTDRNVDTSANTDSNNEHALAVALLSAHNCTKPIFVSVGAGIQLDQAVALVLSTCTFRIPQPIRVADHLSRQIMRQFETQVAQSQGICS